MKNEKDRVHKCEEMIFMRVGLFDVGGQKYPNLPLRRTWMKAVLLSIRPKWCELIASGTMGAAH